MRDFEAYYAAGASWNAGADAYSQSIWNAEMRLTGVNAGRYEALPFVGPPALLPVFGALARLPFDAAGDVWRALLLLCVALLVWSTARLLHPRVTARSLLAMLVAALGFGPLTSALALGQLALPAFACAVLGLGGNVAALFAWTQPNVALTLLAQIANRRGAATFAATLAIFVAACAAVAGIHGLEHYAAVLQRHSAAEALSAIQITPAAIAYGLGASARIAWAFGITVSIAAACAWVVLMQRARDATTRFCATCALLPLVMPFFHEHDLIVTFVPCVLYAARVSDELWPLAAFGALFAATDWLGLAQRPDGTLQTLLLIGALGGALVALRTQPRARALAVPAAALAFIGVAAAFAHAHPAPVWPDAMKTLPNTIRAVDVARAWGIEQHATGLFTRDAVWAVLRALSLAGCVLTATAIALSSRYPAGSRNPSRVPA